MVLSHKKLKQKLRTEIGEVLVTSEAQIRSDVSLPEAPNSNSQQPFKPVEPVFQEPTLSRRAKRGKKAPSLQENGGGDAKEEKADKVVESKKDKRKREEEEFRRAVEERRRIKRQKREDRSKKPTSLQENGGRDAKVEKAEDGSEKAGEGEKNEVKREGGEGNQGLEDRNVKKVAQPKKKKNKKKKNKGKKNVDNDANGKQESLSVGNVEIASESAVSEIANSTTTSISEGSADVSTNVFVGGIPYYSTEDDIRSYFESCGTITEIDCMTFPDTGKFRGIAIMNFKTEAAAKRALALDGSDMGGFFLKIQPYKPTRAEKAPKFSPTVIEGYNRIYAGNLSYDITEEDLRKLFSDCNITSIRFGEDKETKEFRCYAHIDFSDSASLNLALKLDQRVVCGRPIRISRAVPPKRPITTSKNTEVPSAMEKKEAVVPSAADAVVSSVADAVVPSVAEVVPAVSGKIRRRTCYECGERGHLSSACPKKQADDQANAAAS